MGILLYTTCMNIGIIILIAFLGIWGLGIFYGVIGGITKSFHQIPKAADSSDTKAQEQKIIDDTKDKEQKMMDDMKQKMQDAQNKY